MSRCAYLLSLNKESERTIFCKDLLTKIGFMVVVVEFLPHPDPVLSNKQSMQHIYEMILDLSDNENEFSYVFEDDVNVHSDIKIDEIIKYERLNDMFFYLGCCVPLELPPTNQRTGYSIMGYSIQSISGNVRGLHAIGLSKRGARELLKLINTSKHNYMDMILNDFSETYPANVVRFDLQSYINGHRGMFFQDRKKFTSSIQQPIHEKTPNPVINLDS